MSYGSFDARQHQPRQGGEAHPVGKYPFTITDTKIEPTKDAQGGNFVVEFTSPSGQIKKWYNLWPSQSGKDPAKTAEISHNQLSALCHATGILVLNLDNAGAELRGARGMMEIGYQKGAEPTAENPAGGYVELKKVFDANGNEFGKSTPVPQPQPQSHPQALQGNVPQWPGPNPQPQASPPVNPNGGVVGWQPQGTQPSQQALNGPGAAWQQGPTQGAPPWAK